MGSTRLPGKVLRPLGPRPVLDWVVRAARHATTVDDVIVATTHKSEDDAIVDHAAQVGVAVHRGPIDDVLTRFSGAVAQTGADSIVRLTADCPLVDPNLIDAVVYTRRSTAADYASTITPRCLPRGLDVEVISAATLARLEAIATGVHRVHVTSLIHSEPDDFQIVGVTVHPAADDLRVTLDTVDDARLLDELVRRLGDDVPRWRDVVSILRQTPSLAATNAHVEQKSLIEG